MKKIIERILQLGYYPVHFSVVKPGAQLFNKQWYMPRWECDTFQNIADKFKE